MQTQIVGRLVHWATHFLGDRHAAAGIDANWVNKTMALASATATPRTFWGGLNQQVNAIRDSHTSLGAPYIGLSTAFVVRPESFSGPLDVCFGPTINDLGDGNLAFVVWFTGKAEALALEVGDVVTAIDGMDPMAWSELVLPRYQYSWPVDPASDPAPIARQLSSLIATRASTLTITRCTAGVCTARRPSTSLPRCSPRRPTAPMPMGPRSAPRASAIW